jgi:hypothetical protein
VGNVLLGGLITLVATAFVQIVVIPHVQHRNRQVERWENDLLELHALAGSDLHDAAVEVQHIGLVLYAREEMETKNADHDRYSEAVDELNRVTRNSKSVLARIRLRNPHPKWEELDDELRKAALAATNYWIAGHVADGSEARRHFDMGANQVFVSCDAIARRLNEAVRTMRRPQGSGKVGI